MLFLTSIPDGSWKEKYFKTSLNKSKSTKPLSVNLFCRTQADLCALCSVSHYDDYETYILRKFEKKEQFTNFQSSLQKMQAQILKARGFFEACNSLIAAVVVFRPSGSVPVSSQQKKK